MTQVSVARRRWATRFAADQLPTGKQMRRRKEWSHDRCPRCQQAAENSEHVVECMGFGTAEVKARAVARFTQHLEAVSTSTPIKNSLLSLIRASIYKEPIDIEEMTPICQQLCVNQLRLGKEQLLRGRITKGWARTQKDLWEETDTGTQSNRWSVSLIQALWEVSWTLWDHRNSVLKSPEVMDEHYRMENVDLRILEQWNLGEEGMLELDRRFFGTTVEEILQRPSESRRAWLEAVERARTTAAEMQTQR